MTRRRQRTETRRLILVVDDQEETLVSTGRLLEAEGHRVLTARSGDEALEVLRTHEVDLIVVDYMMPRMSGADLVRRIRTTDPYVQIIMQTGYSGERPPRETMEALDIQGYHDKADDPERLLLWVDVACKTHRLVGLLRERERLQGELVANCSHEFRTPLNIIAGYTELLRSGTFGPLGDEAQDALSDVMRATRGLTELVEDFLAYARLENGMRDVAPAPVDVADVALELDRLGHILLDGKPVQLTVDHREAPPSFVTDGTKLRMVLRNLLTNAVKFTDRGHVAVRIARDGDGLRVEVEDTGCGIAADQLESIFEPFRQVDGSTTRAHGGLGLGLALASRMVRLLGGTLSVRSRIGAGSCFVVELPPPAELMDAAASVQPDAEPPRAAAGGR